MKKVMLSLGLAMTMLAALLLTTHLARASVEAPLTPAGGPDTPIGLRQAITQTMVFEANLSGAREVPPVDTPASGRAVLAVSATATDTLYYRVMVEDITNITAAHIHKGAVGVNGPIIFTLFDGSGSFDPNNPISGTRTLTPTQVTDLLNGDYYVNVHTTAHGGGEVRGQVRALNPPTAFNALLSGAGENPPVTTNAVGVSRLTLSNDLNTLSYTVAVSNITNVITAHIHFGSTAQNGPIVFPLGSAPTPTSPITGAVTLSTAKHLVDLLTNFNYVNVHTMDNPGGEIRGQIGGARTFQANLSGANEVPVVTTAATGRSVLGLSADTTTLYYRLFVGNITNITAAHIHRGAVGQNGPIIFTLFGGVGNFGPTNPISGTVTSTLTSAQIFDLIGNNYYINVHTTANPGGEIRGQVNAFSPATSFEVPLSGANEVPPVTTNARGEANLTLTDLNILHYTVAVTNITNVTAAHIHKAPAGVNGPIIFTLFDGGGTFDPSNPLGDGVLLNAENLVDLLTDYYYINVHTTANPGGEIRGQITGPRVHMPVILKN